MAERNEWDAVYRDLIAKGRERVGEPPSPETLVAYSRGELPENEADRVRESLAYYPDLAKALAESEQTVDHSQPYLNRAQREADWQSLRRQMAARRMPPPASSRPWQWATAASLVLAVVCAGMWWMTWRDVRRPHADVERVELFDDSVRGPSSSAQTIRPRPAIRDLVIALTLASPPNNHAFRIEILEFTKDHPRRIWSSAVRRDRDGTFIIAVPRAFLPQGSYRINLYQDDQAEPVATYSLNMVDG